VIIVLSFLAVIDWIYQRWEHRRDLRITRRELLDDLRRMEGDPQVAARMRARGRQLASQRLAGEMPLAGAVIASPRGPAVAVRFDETMSVPLVIGRGRDYLAARIRELGRAHGVTVVEDAKLAGAIYRLCRVGDEIPRKLYERVAEILAFAGQTRIEE
jgi:flagellar biosynthetic protein FlhB